MKNIGLITDISFWEMGIGHSARIRELYAFLHAHSKLTLYYLGEDDCPLPAPVFQSSDKRTELADYLKTAEHDFIIIEKIHLSWVLDLKIQKTLFYLDCHDLISERSDMFQKFNRPCNELSFEKEIECFRKFDKIIFLQKDNKELIAPFIEEERLLLCPHPVIPTTTVPIRDKVESISFLGSPSWVNIDSIQWFHDAVLPLLPDVADKCTVHGTFIYSPFCIFTPRLSKGQLFSSIDTYYNSVDIAINPSLYGSGLKIKTIEAIAYGIPLVTTSIGAAGLLEESNRSFLVADTSEEFAKCIQRLVDSLSLRQELSFHARIFAQKHFTPEACFSSLL